MLRARPAPSLEVTGSVREEDEMRVREIMSAPPLAVAPGTTLKEAAKLLAMRHVSGVPVVEDGTVVGVLSTSDLVGVEQSAERFELWSRWRRRPRALPAGPGTVREAMSAPAVTVEPWISAVGAAWLMTEHDVGRLPVVDHGALVGIVTRSDLVRAFGRSDEDIRREISGEVLPALGAGVGDVEVTVENGVVQLHGALNDELDVRCLPHAVRAVVGVVDVACDVAARHPHRQVDRISQLL